MDNIEQTLFVSVYDSINNTLTDYTQTQSELICNFIMNMNNKTEFESNNYFSKEELEEMESLGINIVNFVGSKSRPDDKQLELTIKASNKLPIGMFIKIVNPKSCTAFITKLKERLEETDFKITTSYNNENKVRVVIIKRINIK